MRNTSDLRYKLKFTDALFNFFKLLLIIFKEIYSVSRPLQQLVRRGHMSISFSEWQWQLYSIHKREMQRALVLTSEMHVCINFCLLYVCMYPWCVFV